MPSHSLSQLLIPLYHIPQQLQPLDRKLQHIRLPIPAQPRLHLPRRRPRSRADGQRDVATLITALVFWGDFQREGKGKHSRCPVLGLAAGGPGGAALAHGVGGAEGAAHVDGHVADDGGRGAGVAGEVVLGPAGVGEAGFEGVELVMNLV